VAGKTALMENVADLARIGLANRPIDEVLQEIAEVANLALGGAESTSITLIRGGRPFTAAHVGQLALDADELQYEQGHGPCMDAGRNGAVLLVRDMRSDDRWPDYAARVTGRGVGSSMSTPLPYQGATIGALNVYASAPAAFGSDDVAVAEEVASYIAVAVANADAHAEARQVAEQMREAMESRSVIDMAKGMLMAQHSCSAEEAFTTLSRASQRSNRKLRDIARAMVDGAVRST
jgi:GAF domain-containing protein